MAADVDEIRPAEVSSAEAGPVETMMDDPGRTWRIGEIAAETGLTVRTLRYYDKLGLLAPSFRNQADHRRYTAADLRRLHQIITMRGFGFSLENIRMILDGPGENPRDLIRGQLRQVEEQITAALRVRRTLHGVLGLLDHSPDPTARTFLGLLEVMTAMERALTPEGLARLTESRQRVIEQLSPEQLAEMSRQRQRLHELLSPEERADLHRRRAARIDFRGREEPPAF